MAGKPKKSGKTQDDKPRKSNAGARIKYNEDFPLLAEGFARRGLSDTQIATNLNINIDTYYRYQKVYPEFYEAIKRGKGPIDIEVENALLKSALGYDYEEVHTEIVKGSSDGSKQSLKKKIVKKHQPGNLGAQIFWLVNRLPMIWKQRKDDDKKDNLEEIKTALAEFMKAL